MRQNQKRSSHSSRHALRQDRDRAKIPRDLLTVLSVILQHRWHALEAQPLPVKRTTRSAHHLARRKRPSGGCHLGSKAV
eukprot:3729817-Rhodomonas_salina.1